MCKGKKLDREGRGDKKKIKNQETSKYKGIMR